LDKLLKVNIVTYSYGKKYAQDIETQQSIIYNPASTTEEIEKAKDELFEL